MDKNYFKTDDWKNIQSLILNLIIWLGLSYFVAAFASFDLNPSAWNWSLRLIIGIFFVITVLFNVKTFLAVKEKIKNK